MTDGLNYGRKGYLRVRISGEGIERFLNLCCLNGIEPWDLRACGKGAVECFMELAQFRRIRPFARKAGVRVRIAGRYGLPFFIYRNRKREGVFCFTRCLFLYGISLLREIIITAAIRC